MDQQVQIKIDALKDLINTVQQSVTFNITTMWTVLAFVVAALGASMYFLIKSWVQNIVNGKIKEITKEITESVSNEMKSKYDPISFSLVPGVEVPIAPFSKPNHADLPPAVFVRAHEENSRYKVHVKGNEVFFTNLDNRTLKFDVLIMYR